jgi:EpsD family peptidyl-prolyl cis-trans isomerase
VKHVIVAVAAAAVLLSGCQRKAGGQTIAVVNGDEITIPEVNFALDQAKVPDGADKNAVRSQVLEQMIDRRLLAQQAKTEGIDKSPDFLNRERMAREELLISMLAARRLNTAQVPSDREVQAFIASHPGVFANREIWSLDQIQYTTPTDANITAEITRAKTMAELMAVLQNHKIAFKEQKNRYDTAMMAPEVYSRVASLAPGEPFVIPAGNQSVASAITGKEAQPIPADKAKPLAVQIMRKQQTAKSIQGLLKSLRSSAKIDYQPGYAPKKS